MRCIERRAKHGFTCELDGRVSLFFPRVGAMSLDTIERVKYFCLRNVRSCGFCRLRNGRSSTRQSRRQDPELLRLLFGWAHREVHDRARISQRARAREKLNRHGWKWEQRCCLHDYARHCLVRVPQLPACAYHGLIHADRLHALFIAYCSYALDLLGRCIDKTSYPLVHTVVNKCHQFRDPVSGEVHPRLKSVLEMKHLTAERRARAIFYFGHVLGTKAEVIAKPELRQHALIIISTLQLLLISVKGLRAYTRRELLVIYQEVGQQFWRSMEHIASHVERARVRRGRRRHEQRPTSTRAPVPFKRMRRDPKDSDDTTDTDDDLTWGGDGMFEYSQKGLPHASLHFPELMMRYGSALGWCSTVQEQSHKKSIKVSARLSRTYASLNVSQDEMMKWSCRQQVWDAVIKLVRDEERDAANQRVDSAPVRHTGSPMMYKLRRRAFVGSFNNNDGTPISYNYDWETTFLNKQVRVTRGEVLNLLCSKLSWRCSRLNRRRLVDDLTWSKWYAALSTHGWGMPHRNFVGVGAAGAPRRDFVRIHGPLENNTCLTAQIIAFVEISGFNDQLVLPTKLRNPPTNSRRVTLALVRWLAPHPDALLRDSDNRPIAPSPLDINHALWKFAETQRPVLTPAVLEKNLSYYDGHDRSSRVANANLERTAMFDLLEPETFTNYVNCTEVNVDRKSILETITLPF